MKKHVCLLLLVLTLFELAACAGTLEVGIERTPTAEVRGLPTPDGHLATVEALTVENARLAATIAAYATSSVTATPPPPELGRVAYVQGGDIWVKLLPDDRPQRLTTDGRNRSPAWSPSGNWLAFRKERYVVIERETLCDTPNMRRELCRESASELQQQVWLVEEDGSNARPLNQNLSVEGFAWSPVRDRLAYVTTSGQLQAVNGDGTNLATLFAASTVDHSPGKIGRIAWSPDGAWIAYEYALQGSEPAAAYQSIWKVSADGRERVQLYGTEQGRSDLWLAGWSSAGKLVYFWQDPARPAISPDGAPLFGVSAAGQPAAGAAVGLSSEPMLPYRDFIATAPPHTNWGEREAVALAVGAGQGTWANKRIETSAAVSPPGVAAISPAWSPDGRRLAYAAMPERETLGLSEPTLQELMARRVWVADAAGEGRPQQITDDPGYRDEFPRWSADGTYLLFARINAKGRASLWIVPAGSGALRQVVDELTPAPDPIGTYGHVEWDNLFDWWRG